MSAAASALTLAACGWPVFPCKPGSKEPATEHGFKDASTDERVIRSWWARIPAANLAIATGAPAVDVLDVDVKSGGSGYPAFNRLKRAGMLAGALAIVQTPSGGLHVYYTGTGQPCGRLARHYLDFKASGGYVLCPPSAVNGRPYQLLDTCPAGGQLDWRKAAALLDPPTAAGPPRRRETQDRGGAPLAEWLAGQPEGNRNHALFWAACRAAEAGLDPGDLADAAVATGLTEVEARRTIASARRRVGGAI
jgi:hypothetical protein